MVMLCQRFYIIGFSLLILLVTTTYAQEKPLKDLSRGQEGKIFFSSTNNPTFKSILTGGSPGEHVTIFGTLSMPKNTSAKVPAVIILPGVSGATDHYFEVASALNDIGFAAFVVDSHKPRNIQGASQAFKNLAQSMRVADAYAALKLLSTHPGIYKDRIALMGWGRGGSVALFASSEKIRRSLSSGDLRFAATIVYYPCCLRQVRNIDFTGAPILMLLAEKDNVTLASICIDYAQRANASGAGVKFVVYKDAYCAFDFSSLSGQVIPYPALSDFTKCKHKYLQLQDDGTWFCPYTEKRADNLADFGDLTADCKVEGGGIIGGPEEARTESIGEYQAFLKRIFNLP
jgi:dienelactone hydrolase